MKMINFVALKHHTLRKESKMDITIPLIKQKFDEYNQQMFGGKLPTLPIKLSNAKTFLGKCCFTTRRGLTGKVEYRDFFCASTHASNYLRRSWRTSSSTR